MLKRTITANTAALYLSLYVLEGFTDITLKDYELPKFCEV